MSIPPSNRGSPGGHGFGRGRLVSEEAAAKWFKNRVEAVVVTAQFDWPDIQDTCGVASCPSAIRL